MIADFFDRRVLVTGAGGFIGSHLTERLVREGATVRAFVRYNSRNDTGLLQELPRDIRDSVEVVAGDLRDPFAVLRATAGIQTVFHLGAIISIPYSYVHPAETAETNMIGTLNVLEACRTVGARLVHTSTSEVYGSALRVPIDETHPLQGQSPYSASKIGADKLVESYHCAYGLPVVTVRPFNTYGPRQSSRAVIPTIITQALSGDTVRLGNLEAQRDFTFVSDTVEAFLLAAGATAVDGDVFNLGTGEAIAIGELADLIVDLVDRSVIVETDAARIRPAKSEVTLLLSDNGRARARLGWRPRVSLVDGLQATIDWIAQNLHAYRVGRYEI